MADLEEIAKGNNDLQAKNEHEGDPSKASPSYSDPSIFQRYQRFMESHKRIAFFKNITATSVVFALAGAAGAKVTEQMTDSKSMNAFVSIASQYLAGFSFFMTTHAMDNPDKYRSEDGSLKKWQLIKDTGKLTFAMGFMELAYVLGRPTLHYQIMQHGYSPAKASILADVITTPVYWIVAVPIAQKLGIIEPVNKSSSE